MWPWCQIVIIVTLWCHIVCDGDSDGVPSGLEDSPLIKIRAVEGGRVLFPCDMDPPTKRDTTLLVLFYRADGGTPIYSLDSRSVSLERAHHWAAPELQNRAYLKVRRGHHGLLLERVRVEDKGEYRCRVDFRESPTRNVRIHLDVLVPPKSIVITSDLDPGRDVKGGAGPYAEGERVTLACQVIGGDPRPKLTWWQDWSLLDTQTEVDTGHLIKNLLNLPPLTRADLNKTLTCQATNSDLIIPVSATVRIDMHYPPTSVKLLEQSEEEAVTLSEGRSRPLVCEAKGSRPPAHLTWVKDGEPLDGNVTDIEEEVEGELSRSILNFTATANDDGVLITCRGHSPHLPKFTLEDSARLSVFYKPRVELQLQTDHSSLEEGDDVTLECLLNANPPTSRIEWEHNGRRLVSNASQGIELSWNQLFLKNLDKESSGAYTCIASNSEGSSTSSPVHLRVKFLPICSQGVHKSYGTGIKEEIVVSCQVEAYPAPTDFRWMINTSQGISEFTSHSSMDESDDAKFSLESGVANLPPQSAKLSPESGDAKLSPKSGDAKLSSESGVARFSAESQDDFGELYCWAVNEVGLQREPCVYQVVPAAKPQAVISCVAERNATMPPSYVFVTCLPGWDGGLRQTFILEVRQEASEEVLEDLRDAPIPQFYVRGLQANTHYLLTVQSQNARGLSPPVTLSYCLDVPTSANAVVSHVRNTLLVLMPFVVLLMGVLLVLTVYVGVGVLRATREKRRKSEKEFCDVAVGRGGGEGGGGGGEELGIKECEKEELMKLSVSNETQKSIQECTEYLLNNLGHLTTSLETDFLLKEKLATLACLPPLPSSDTIGRCPTPSSICTSSSKGSCRSYSSSKSSHSSKSTSTVALNPDYVGKAEVLYSLVGKGTQESAV